MERGSSTPLWKIVLGVTIGVLLADLLRIAWMALAIGSMIGAWGISTSNPGKITERRAPPAAVAQQPQVQALEGPLTAHQRSLSRACINGTVAERHSNGWSQIVVDGGTQPCRAKSQ